MLHTEIFFGQCTGLVKNDRIDLGQHLQGLQASEQHAALGQCTRSGQHGRWCSQGQGTRTGYDKHRNRHHQGMGRALLPAPQGRQACRQKDTPQKWFGNFIGDQSHAGFRHRGTFHQGHHLAKTGLLA